MSTSVDLPGVHLVSEPLPPLFRDVVGLRAAATYRFTLSRRVDLTAGRRGSLKG